MTVPVESIIILGQQAFELSNTLDLVEVEINDDKILNVLNNIKIFTPLAYYFYHQ